MSHQYLRIQIVGGFEGGGFGGSGEVFFAGIDAMEEPGHVFAEVAHDGFAFLVIFDLLLVHTEAHIPVAGAGDDHFGDEEEMVDGVVGEDGAGSSGDDDGGADFSLKHVAVGPLDKTRAVDEGLQFRRHIGKINGGGKDDCVGVEHFLDAPVGDVVIENACFVFGLEASIAGPAAMNGFAGELDQFRPDSLFFEFLEYVPDEDGRIAVFSRAAIECHDFHEFVLHASFAFSEIKRA